MTHPTIVQSLYYRPSAWVDHDRRLNLDDINRSKPRNRTPTETKQILPSAHAAKRLAVGALAPDVRASESHKPQPDLQQSPLA